MTRFARSKGSKASNERQPEEATPWSEMKQQLVEKNKEIAESKNRQDAIKQRNANYKAFLENKEEEERKMSQWAEFPAENEKQTMLKRKRSFSAVDDFDKELSDDETFVALKAKVDKVLMQSKYSNDDDSDGPPEEQSSKVPVKNAPIKTKKIKKKKLSIPSDISQKSENSITQEENKPTKNNIDTPRPKKILKLAKETEISQPKKNGIVKEGKKAPKRKNEDISNKLLIQSDISQKNENNITQEKNIPTKNNKDTPGLKKKTKLAKETEINQEYKNCIKKSKQKGTVQPKKILKENLTEADLKKIEKKKQKRLKQMEKKKKAKAEKIMKNEQEKTNPEIKDSGNATEDKQNTKFDSLEKNKNFKGNIQKNNGFSKINEKKNKRSKDEEHQRKKPHLPTKMFINGKDVEIDYVDGFPVKKEDAIRLKKLRKEMISKGLPRSEINISLKLERRKAEKAFAREKKKVCFNCRKSGHNLSECPDLDKGEVTHAGSGICFKCGSTEHTHFECKVVRGQEFKYAQCFICNEQGHIARQCPDNAKGLYPKGGACKVCGDVTHLKKDCPKYQHQQQQLQSSLNIETFSGNNPDLLENNYNGNFNLGNKRPNKIVKF